MAANKVQIGGGDDPHARYKRPRLQIKVEGAGNGIKTVLTNLEDIALHLHVDPEYPCKFFGMQLGVQSRSETQKLNSKASKNAKAVTRYIINGQHQAQLLEPLLVEFEKAFVCCPKCVAAEIRLAVSKKEVVTYDCRACGANGELPTKHKFLSYIAKHPPSKTVRDTVAQAPATRLMDGAKDEDDATESDKKVKSSKKGAEKEDEEVQWATDTSAEAQRKRMEEEMAAMTVKGADVVAGGKAAAAAASSTAAAEAKTPIAPAVDTKDLAPADAAAALFHAYMTVPASAAAIEAAKKAGKKKPSAFAHTADENVAELRRICLVRSLDDEHRIVVALKALLVATDKTKDEKSQNAAFPAAIETHAPTLRKLAAANKAAFLAGYELLVEQRSKLVGYVPHCMKALYDADVLEEDDIVTWHATPNANATNTSMRAKAKPFVDWLKNAEEDD